MHLSELLLFVGSLSAGKLLGSFCLRSQALSLGKLGTSLRLGLLLLLALLFNFETELLFLLLLLFDDRKVVLLLVILLGGTGLLAVRLLVVFSIDGGVVLVLATTALALGLASQVLVFLVDLAGKQVTLLPVQLAHEILLSLVALHGDLIDGLGDLRLSVDVVLEATDHVFSGELVVPVVLGNLVRR